MVEANGSGMSGGGEQIAVGSLDLIATISARTNVAEEIGGVLEFATDRLVEFLGWQVGTAWLARPDGRFEMVHSRDSGGRSAVTSFLESTEVTVFDPGAEVITRSSRTSFSAMVTDISAAQTLERTRAAARAGLRTAMLVPIWVGQRVRGGLEFYSTEKVTVERHVVRACEQVCMHLSRVLERQEARTDLRSFLSNGRTILDAASDAFLSTSRTGRITAWNRTAEDLFGWSADEVLGRTLSEFIVPPRLREVHNRRVRKILQNGFVEPEDRRSEAVALHRDGHEFPVEVTRWVMDDESSRLCAFIRDLIARRVSEERLRVNATLDPLTQLSNRTHLIDQLCTKLDRRDSSKGSMAILYLDIDQFKLINESLGHDVGDEVLVAVASRFAGLLDPGDTLARLSGDEFVMVRESVASPDEMTDLAERLLESLREPVQLIDDTVFVTASIGITFPQPQCTGCTPPNAERLVHAARMAMQHARSTGAGYFEEVDSVSCSSAPVRRHIVSDLRRALDHGEFRVHYQPEVRVEDGMIVGVEALLRWMHPEHGLQAPASFIDALEQSGLIVHVGRWVMEEVAHQARLWQDDLDPSLPPLNVWTNVSTRQFAQSDLVSTIGGILGADGLDPERVRFGIELTESSLMNHPEHALTTLHELRDMGLKLAIDDFGTGYSSLAYLKDFPATTLKIDRSFILGVADHVVDRSIVEGIVGLAKSLDLEIVAEGVENAAQFQVLGKLGIDLAQGYLFSRPLPAKAMTERLLRRTVPTTVLLPIRPRIVPELGRTHALGS